MKIKILKMTPNKKRKNIIYIDLEIEDLFIKVKGVRLRKGPENTYRVGMPTLPTESGQKYSYFIFTTKEKIDEFTQSIVEAMSKYLPPEELKDAQTEL